jgi:hypothetical protein
MNAFPDNNNFDSRLKDLAANAESDLPEGSWDRLRMKQAEKKNRKKIFYAIVLSSAIMLLITGSIYFFYYAYRSGTESIKQSGINVPAKESAANTADKDENYSEKEKPVADSHATNVNNTANVYNNNSFSEQTNSLQLAEKKTVLPKNTIINEKTLAVIENKLPAKEAQTTEQASEQIFISLQDSMMKDSSLSENIYKDTAKINELAADTGTLIEYSHEIHIGCIYNLNMPWILNQNTYGEFGGKELAYKLAFASAYGITIGCDFGKRYGLQTGIIINSSQGQKYHDTFSAYGTIDREVALDYLHVPLLFKIKFKLKQMERPPMISFAAGLQYGHLKKASETVNNVTTDITERFNRSEIGVVFNIESDIYFANSFYFTLGLNSSLGNNINQKDWEQYVSHSNGHSYNMLVGAAFGLSYYFPVK